MNTEMNNHIDLREYKELEFSIIPETAIRPGAGTIGNYTMCADYISGSSTRGMLAWYYIKLKKLENKEAADDNLFSTFFLKNDILFGNFYPAPASGNFSNNFFKPVPRCFMKCKDNEYEHPLVNTFFLNKSEKIENTESELYVCSKSGCKADLKSIDGFLFKCRENVYCINPDSYKSVAPSNSIDPKTQTALKENGLFISQQISGNIVFKGNILIKKKDVKEEFIKTFFPEKKALKLYIGGRRSFGKGLVSFSYSNLSANAIEEYTVYARQADTNNNSTQDAAKKYIEFSLYCQSDLIPEQNSEFDLEKCILSILKKFKDNIFKDINFENITLSDYSYLRSMGKF